MSWSTAAIQLVKDFNIKIIPIREIQKKDKYILIPCAIFKQTREQWLAENPDEAKTPLFSTQDSATIIKWAAKYPAYGVVAGNDTFIIDVDIDKGKQGKKAIKWLFKHGLPKKVFTVTSPSGGMHLYYHKPSYPTLQAGVCVDIGHKDVAEYHDMLKGRPSGIDVRHGNAFCVGPMSVKNKGMYTVKRTGERGVIPFALKIAEKKSSTQLVSTEQSDIVDKDEKFFITSPVKEGERNEYARDFTFWMSNRNLTPGETLSEFKRLQLLVGDGVTREEIVSMYERIVKKNKDDPFSFYLNRFVHCPHDKLMGWFDLETQELSSHSFYKLKFADQMVTIKDRETGKNRRINPFDLLLSDKRKQRGDSVMYYPGKPVLFVEEASWGAVCNTWKPWPLNIQKDETLDVDQYVDAFKQVFNNLLGEHTSVVKCWVVATLFAPSVRAMWSLYIISELHGVGKDLMVEVIFSLFGAKNTLIDANINLFTARFNGILCDKVMVAFSDFPKIVSSKDRNEIKSAIKKITTAARHTFERKGVEYNQYPIFSRFIFTNNDDSAMEVDRHDRRLYIIKSRAKPLSEDIYDLAGLCSREDEQALPEAMRRQCRRLIIEWLKETCGRSVEECVEFVRHRPAVTADKKIVQLNSENLRLVKTRAAIKSHMNDGIPTYRGAHIFHSSVVTEASLQAFLSFEIHQQKTSIELYIRELEDEGIIKRERYGETPTRPRGHLSTISIPKETFFIDQEKELCRTIQGPTKQVKCWIVCDLWGAHKPHGMDKKSWSKSDFKKEYNQLFVNDSVTNKATVAIRGVQREAKEAV